MTPLYCSHTDGTATHKLEDCPLNKTMTKNQFIQTAVQSFEEINHHENDEHTQCESLFDRTQKCDCFARETRDFFLTTLQSYRDQIRAEVEGRLCALACTNDVSRALKILKYNDSPLYVGRGEALSDLLASPLLTE